MNDAHLNRQHRLQYLVRGPEWAFAIPQGDMDALEDVMRRCSEFWNGVGSLIIPVAKNGRVAPGIDVLLHARGVEACLLHPSLSIRAAAGVERLGLRTPALHDRFDEREVHPLHFAEGLTTGEPSVFIPRFSSAGLRRVALATWGNLPDEHIPYWRQWYSIGDLVDDAAYRALVSGQVGPIPTSPLALSASHMRLVAQAGPQDWPYVFVFGSRVTFRELVNFWNLRARSLGHHDATHVLGLPYQALEHPDQLQGLQHWGASPSWLQRTPDFLVAATEETADPVERAFSAIGFDRDSGTKLTTTFGATVELRERPSYRFAAQFIGGEFVRGAHASTLVGFTGGKSSFSLLPPAGFDIRNGRHVRLSFRNLPLPLPTTASAARRVNANASAFDGVTIETNATDQWNFDVALAGAWDALQDWARDQGYTAELSQPGRYGTALLNRLGELARLDVLADELRIDVLQRLTPESRLKLTQRLTAAMAEQQDADEREFGAHLAESISDIGLFLEVESRPAADIGGLLGKPKRDVLKALAPLVEAGLIQRGRAVTCPQCNYRAFELLVDLEETMRCRACREEYVLPVIDAGSNEPPTTFQLDGLMARVMDQDILPVLLTLRALRNQLGTDLFFAWPGVEFERDSAKVETDLLVSTGDQVFVSEVKSNAENLDQEQLDGLLALAEDTGALPVIAGLTGTFDSDLVGAVRGVDGRVFHRADLLA